MMHESFEQFFQTTELFATLNAAYTVYEIFELNNGLYELSSVQAAYEKYELFSKL
ncbi:hypothetical protein N5J48_12485 [Acinetobacter ursingii]|uniref:hypothetical protein n=1 Tax=Acinetobacter ursingii TaxID=108980 RepID=UPI00244A0FA5|nr:hypothetical protein [Acinetobacter ursingii]MDH0008357.1 hypothetical protein [Acinetobacter ursingii]MDH0480191.1 hypothetical protein [Acinetobacter ursingii]MDH2120799.1 hypothetical protein [Acinetobacter ursingii]MDH2128369.1 hypothetical protein [Acinetobacter ursingii]